MRRIIPTHLHPRNNDPTARLVSSRRSGDTQHNVYQVAGGFIAGVGHGQCIEGTFDTIEDARDAQDNHATGEAHEEILAGLASERPHSRIKTASGQPVQWTYDGHGGMA